VPNIDERTFTAPWPPGTTTFTEGAAALSVSTPRSTKYAGV
jgi:hypothetical protein